MDPLFKGVREGTAIEKVEPFFSHVLEKYPRALGHCCQISGKPTGRSEGDESTVNILSKVRVRMFHSTHHRSILAFIP